MYKTISINNTTYQQLHALAAKLQKPKSQVIDDLIREFIDKMHEEEKNALRSYNASVKRLSRRIKLPRSTTENSDSLAVSFESISLPHEDAKKSEKRTFIINRHES